VAALQCHVGNRMPDPAACARDRDLHCAASSCFQPKIRSALREEKKALWPLRSPVMGLSG